MCLLERTEDVIYGRKDGMVLTLDVFTPKHSNGAGVIFAVSGGWVSAHDGINGAVFSEFLNRGYTVFAVVHGSQPRYTIPEVIKDMQRAVRFIRYNAVISHRPGDPYCDNGWFGRRSFGSHDCHGRRTRSLQDRGIRLRECRVA